MIVIDEHAEPRLLAQLERFRHAPQPWRALYLRTTLAQRERLPLADLMALLKQHVSATDPQIYLLSDGETIILAERVSAREGRLFDAALASQLGLKPGNAIAQLFEVEHSWNYLIYLVDEKQKRLEAEAAERRRAAEAEQQARLRENILSEEAPSVMLRSLADRRAQHERPVIMIIEDDIFSRRLVEGVLRDRAEMVSLGSGEQAIQTYVHRAPHVLFLDINLPDVSGHDLLARITELDPDSYIVMLSGNGDRANVARAIENGARGFIGKPFTKDKLEKYVSKCPTLKKAKGISA